MENQPLLLSVQEAAKRLSLSSWTLRLWVKHGKLRCVRMGSRVLIEPSELDRLIAASRKPAEENRNG
jgi:excisionase family DNA binding protein